MLNCVNTSEAIKLRCWQNNEFVILRWRSGDSGVAIIRKLFDMVCYLFASLKTTEAALSLCSFQILMLHISPQEIETLEDLFKTNPLIFLLSLRWWCSLCTVGNITTAWTPLLCAMLIKRLQYSEELSRCQNMRQKERGGAWSEGPAVLCLGAYADQTPDTALWPNGSLLIKDKQSIIEPSKWRSGRHGPGQKGRGKMRRRRRRVRNFMVEFKWRTDGPYPRGLYVPGLFRENHDLLRPTSVQFTAHLYQSVPRSPSYSLSPLLCLSPFVCFYPFTYLFYFISVWRKIVLESNCQLQWREKSVKPWCHLLATNEFRCEYAIWVLLSFSF